MSWGFALSGFCNLVNGKLQRDFQKEQNEINREANRQLQELQLKEAREKELRQLARDNERIADKSSWPLRLPASLIRANFSERVKNGVVPVMVIIANVECKTIMQKSLGDLWLNMSRFMNNHFPSHGATPIFYYNGGYKDGFAAEEADVIATHALIPDIPTIFISPHTRKQDNVLSVLVASWGFSSGVDGFRRDWFDLDIRTPYVEAIRKEVCRYQSDVRPYINPEDEKPEVKRNIDIFEKEKGYLEQGRSVAQIDQLTKVYVGLTPFENTYERIVETIAPLFKMLVSSMIDLYHVYECQLLPRVPQILVSGDVQITDQTTRKLLEYYAQHISAAVQNGIIKMPKKELEDFAKRLEEAGLTQAQDEIRLLAESRRSEDSQPKEDYEDANVQLEIAIKHFSQGELSECLRWARRAAEQGNADAKLLQDEVMKVIKKHKLG